MKTSEIVAVAVRVAMVLCLASAVMAQTPAKTATSPNGEAVVSSVSVTATVTKLDQKTRAVTVKTDDGQERSFVAGDAVKNLAQVKVGDVITATYTEALVYEVKKGGQTGAQSAVASNTAAAGMPPGGTIAQKTTVTVIITAIDPKVPSVTFRGPAGNSRTIKVQRPEKLEGVKVGDTVDITYAEALAITVAKPAGK